MSRTSPALDFQVARDDLRNARQVEVQVPEPQDGEVLLRIERFAFTSNNITYAVFGEAMQYWKFFPAPDGWGRIPVWGFAEVTESKHAQVGVGERIYGYLPMSTHLIVQPERVSTAAFMDGSTHRRPLPGAYQQYSRVTHDSDFSTENEDLHALLRPLFFTSFLIDDFLADNDLFGARAVVLSSASSKTALGTAFLLKHHGRCEVIGLTSPGNAAFCAGLGCYDRVLGYDQLQSLPADTPTVFVDMAGNGTLLHDIHHHFGDSLKHSCMVGGTHWEQRETQHALPGPRPEFFFAPTRIKKRMQDWGPDLGVRFSAAWRPFQQFVA
ncbi:MAG: DUF2855 family protein, partial [Nevskiales bacterium]